MAGNFGQKKMGERCVTRQQASAPKILYVIPYSVRVSFFLTTAAHPAPQRARAARDDQQHLTITRQSVHSARQQSYPQIRPPIPLTVIFSLHFIQYTRPVRSWVTSIVRIRSSLCTRNVSYNTLSNARKRHYRHRPPFALTAHMNDESVSSSFTVLSRKCR